MHKFSKFLVFALIIFALCVVTFTMCSPEPNPACEADNLLLVESAFPGDGWQELGSRDVRGAPSPLGIERAGTSFSTLRQGVAIQDFYRFASESEARKSYDDLRVSWFNLAPKGSVYSLPEELSDIKLGADEYRLGCYVDMIETCRFVGLYQTYVVEFKADMPALTYDYLTDLLEQIDQSMLRCVDNSPS